MRFAYTAEQQLFADTIRQFLADRCPPERVRRVWEGRADRAVWEGLAEMGVVGLLAPDSAGGLGMTDVDLHPLLIETGRVALPDPIVDTAAVAVPMLRDARHPQLAAVAAGGRTVGVGFDGDPVVRADADALLLQRGEEWHLVDAAEVSLTPARSVDGARHLGSVAWEPNPSSLVTDDATASELARHRAIVGVSAQLLGLARHLLDQTVAYVQVREQFGRPIGSYQALKHKLTDTLLAIEFAEPVAARAAQSLTDGDPEAGVHASMAKCFAADAAALAARHALQCHGAIAYTVEYDLHMWLKRVWALAAQWGAAREHRRTVARHLLGSSR